MMHDLNRRRIIERQKAKCREKINFHAQNVMLQGFVSLFFISAGLHYAQKKNIVVPLVAAPLSAFSLSKLVTHETKRRRYKAILNELERD